MTRLGHGSGVTSASASWKTPLETSTPNCVDLCEPCRVMLRQHCRAAHRPPTKYHDLRVQGGRNKKCAIAATTRQVQHFEPAHSGAKAMGQIGPRSAQGGFGELCERGMGRVGWVTKGNGWIFPEKLSESLQSPWKLAPLRFCASEGPGLLIEALMAFADGYPKVSKKRFCH